MYGQRESKEIGWGGGTVFQNMSSFIRTLRVEGSTYREAPSRQELQNNTVYGLHRC